MLKCQSWVVQSITGHWLPDFDVCFAEQWLFNVRTERRENPGPWQRADAVVGETKASTGAWTVSPRSVTPSAPAVIRRWLTAQITLCSTRGRHQWENGG